jgi:hypothetical protein
MTLEELSRVSEAMGIQSDLLCIFLSTGRWIRSRVAPFGAKQVGYRCQYLHK